MSRIDTNGLVVATNDTNGLVVATNDTNLHEWARIETICERI